MTADNHLHIGQFYEAYYEPLEVLRIAAEAGITDAVYSSTTSAKEGVCYREVEREIAAVAARYPAESYKPFLWHIPPYIDQGLSVESAFQNLPYQGIKLHPRARRQILEAGFGGRLIPGTDFPITHYFNRKSGLTLENQYREDLAQQAKYFF
jgi:predicted TIM-barrel fold metal-dependent hydrolase